MARPQPLASRDDEPDENQGDSGCEDAMTCSDDDSGRRASQSWHPLTCSKRCDRFAAFDVQVPTGPPHKIQPEERV